MDKYYNFYFMEMNTRIQVEHLITEMVSLIDIVELQINIACNKKLHYKHSYFLFYGHSIEVRIYAETPDYNFFPSTGKINYIYIPNGLNTRVDTGILHGTTITSHYDPILMKVATWGKTRNHAIKNLIATLKDIILSGCTTNLSFLLNILYFDDFVHGLYGI